MLFAPNLLSKNHLKGFPLQSLTQNQKRKTLKPCELPVCQNERSMSSHGSAGYTTDDYAVETVALQLVEVSTMYNISDDF